MSAHLETRRDNYAVIIVKYNYDFNEDWNFTADQMVCYISVSPPVLPKGKSLKMYPSVNTGSGRQRVCTRTPIQLLFELSFVLELQRCHNQQ